jgi:hypothetical protein
VSQSAAAARPSASTLNADGLRVDAQQPVDRSLGRFVVALADVVVADATVAIDEVEGGPVPVRQRLQLAKSLSMKPAQSQGSAPAATVACTVG